MIEQALGAEAIFPHVRIVMGMIIGLGITRLLSGVARIVQHPRGVRLYSVHLIWAASILLTMVHFWWWEFGLHYIAVWTFPLYFFILAYAITLFLLCALLFPENMHDYTSYENYFNDRRAWFFGVLALTYVLDIIDTLVKGQAHFAEFGPEVLIHTPIYLVLCLIAAWTSSRRFHLALVLGTVAYQMTWIYRLSYSLY